MRTLKVKRTARLGLQINFMKNWDPRCANFSLRPSKRSQTEVRLALWRGSDRRLDQHLHRSVVIPAFRQVVRIERLRFSIPMRRERAYMALDMPCNVRFNGVSAVRRKLRIVIPVSYTHLRAHETGRNLV